MRRVPGDRGLALATGRRGPWTLAGSAVAAVAAPSVQRLPDWRARVATVLGIAAVAVVSMTWPMLATAWAIASRDGLAPSASWGEIAGNHGPWSRLYNLRLLVEHAQLLPMLAPAPAFLALLVNPTLAILGRAVVVTAASLVTLLAVIGGCGWLVD